MILVGAYKLDIDIYQELEPYLHMFTDYRVRDDKLQSCSPFRQDNHPSFAVNLLNGSWIDSGAVGEYHKGHFITLLSYLRNETAENTTEYLLDLYSVERKEADTLQLDVEWLKPATTLNLFLGQEELRKYAFRHSYLGNRGITEEIQRLFRVGYCRETEAVVMPHTDKLGNIVNIKFRSVKNKKFWYAHGQPVKYHLYGLYQCIIANAQKVWIVESETDCMRLWSEGYHAVALGTAHISNKQIKLLLNSPVDSLVIATDNDSAGRECCEHLKHIFAGTFDISVLKFPGGVKDICDMTSQQIKNAEFNSLIDLDLGCCS